MLRNSAEIDIQVDNDVKTVSLYGSSVRWLTGYDGKGGEDSWGSYVENNWDYNRVFSILDWVANLRRILCQRF